MDSISYFNLVNLREIIEGLNSLAKIEKEHPELGDRLYFFVNSISENCGKAYNRLSETLSKVRALPAKPTNKEIKVLLNEIRDVANGEWFKKVERICEQLAALAEDYKEPIKKQIAYLKNTGNDSVSTQNDSVNPAFWERYKIINLLQILQRHEADLKADLRMAVNRIEMLLGDAKSTQNVQEAKEYAFSVQNEIAESLGQINKLCLQIAAGSSKGVSVILDPAEIAENALRRPEQVLILNMFFLCVALGLGAAAFQFVDVYQFILITGFAITAVVVVNAFYLRTIDKLSEESFLKLMQLALLKFFAPLTKGTQSQLPKRPVKKAKIN